MIIDRKNSYQALEIAESLDNDNELQILLVDRYEDFSFWITQEEIEKIRCLSDLAILYRFFLFKILLVF